MNNLSVAYVTLNTKWCTESGFESHHYHYNIIKYNNMETIDNCMRNTFGVITHRMSIDEVFEMYEGKDAMFYGDPLNISTEELEDILNYFENTEEYEYCSELKELITAKNFAEMDMFLHDLAEENGITLM